MPKRKWGVIVLIFSLRLALLWRQRCQNIPDLASELECDWISIRKLATVVVELTETEDILKDRFDLGSAVTNLHIEWVRYIPSWIGI
jgi:hypothetical protein